MALSDDQRAMLRLLAQREEGYDDIAALMGLSVDEVRAKVKEALEAIDDPGQATKPVELAKQSPKPSEPTPEQPKPARPSAPAGAPEAQKEKVGSKPARGARPARSSNQKPRLMLPSDRGTRLAIFAGVAAILLVVVLLVVT